MIDGLVSKITGRAKYKKEDNPEPPFPNAESIEDKIKQIVLAKRFECYQEDVRRARVYYRMDLFFRGYQNLGPWDEINCTYPIYDEEPMEFTENRFRRAALILQGSLLKMEPASVVRPASSSNNDMEAAKAAEGAWDIICDNIGIDEVRADKSLFKVLFGSAFVYSDYQIDKRFGTLMVPKFRYEDVEIPGGAFCQECGSPEPTGAVMCPQCGMPTEQVPPMQTQAQIPDGFTERTQGREFSTVFTPLEVSVRSKVKGGFKNAPYLLVRSREDVDVIRYVYPKLDVKSASIAQHYGVSGGADFENALRYQDILAALPGNTGGPSNPQWATTNYFSQVDVVRAWLMPQLFKGDKELLKQCPDGLMAVLVEGEVVEWRAESMFDHWTHEVGIRVPHSLHGDPLMLDNLSVQRMLNRVNQLQVRHLDYSTVPERLYDEDLISPEEATNDPAKRWHAVNTSAEKGLDAAVRDLNPVQLSQDLYQFRAQIYQADQDISGATDPLGGKIAGANTPYSAQVLAVEQGQTRLVGTAKYNTTAVRNHVTQLLTIAQKNWIDPRTKMEIDETIGKTTWSHFVGSDLAQGSWSVKILTNDFKPKTRAEAMAGLEYLKEFGVDVLGSPKMRLDFFEKVGVIPDGDTLSTQARRAYRVIEKIRQGQQMVPNPLVDDGMIQASVFQEFLASQQGDQLLEENPQAWQMCLDYMQTVIQMAAMRNAAMGNMGMPGLLGPQVGGPGGGPQGPPPAKPGQPPGGQPGQNPGGPKTEEAQSPADQKQPMPAMPQGVH